MPYPDDFSDEKFDRYFAEKPDDPYDEFVEWARRRGKDIVEQLAADFEKRFNDYDVGPTDDITELAVGMTEMIQEFFEAPPSID